MRSSYLYNGYTLTGKMASLYWDSPLIFMRIAVAWQKLQGCSPIKFLLAFYIIPLNSYGMHFDV